MIYKKRLNNNAVVAVDGKTEKILTGRGIGFQIKEGQPVDESRIEKIFSLSDQTMNRRLQELCETIPIEYVYLAEEIIDYAKAHINAKISENAILPLCDHIYMAIERKKQGIDVKNFLLWDIQKFYREEYAVGQYAVRLIQKRFQTELNEDEAGFIAFHIVSSQLETQTKAIQKMTVLMQEIETIVRMTFSITLDTDSVYYHRFVSHLKFFAERVFSNRTYQGKEMNGLLDVIKETYPESYACALRINEFIQNRYHYHLSREELLYLSIHISRIVQVSSQQ